MTSTELQNQIIAKVAATDDVFLLKQVALYLQALEGQLRDSEMEMLTESQKRQLQEAIANVHNPDYWVSWDSIKSKYSQWH